ncbi:hypothetical protein [Magnetococcus sp. PR-3]|uniref:hypothetical protein n=1 Tax=Magnetococcus sp. PR-3 TaxID=3120355 RepID=UPI002FCE126B
MPVQMKERNIRRVASAAFVSAALLLPITASAFDGSMPPSTNQLSSSFFNALPLGQPEPLIKTQVIRKGLMHPVDYWWYTDPSLTGKWDYYTPVAQTEQPVEVMTQQTALLRPSRPPQQQVYNYDSYNVVVNPPHAGPTPHNYVVHAPAATYSNASPTKNSNGHINTWLNGSIPVRYVSMVETRAPRHKATIYR